MIVTMLTAKIETSVTIANPRSAVNAPRIAVTPIASGRLAAAKLPKMITSITARIGSEMLSARAMSALTCPLMSVLMTALPPILMSSPGAVRSSRICSMAASSSPSVSCRTAKVDCRSVLTRLGAPVLQNVVVRSTRPSGSAPRESSTAVR